MTDDPPGVAPCVLAGGDVVLHLGDCMRVLPTLADGSVDAVLADPPYGMGWDTDSTRFTGGNPAFRRGKGRDDWGEIVDDGAPFDPRPWLAFPRVALWGANHYATRLPVGTTLVWIKKADHLFGTFLSDAEVGWMKGGHGVYCFRKQFPPPSRAEEAGGRCAHPAQKPISLMRWVLDKLKVPRGATVFDPYMGSGTVGIACVQTGRRYVGCEVNPAHYATACARLAHAIGPLFSQEPHP